MVQKQSVVDLAVDSIINYICESDLKEGEKLPPEMEMTRMLGISRPALREAYVRLEAIGFIEIQKGRGAFVRSKNRNLASDPLAWFKDHKTQVNDYLEVRLVLDPLEAKLAARHHGEEEILKLKKAKEAFEEAYKAGDGDRMAVEDANFHNTIAEMTKNELIMAMSNLINVYCTPLREQSLSLNEHASHAIEPHQRIFDAIASRDEVKAAEESLKHMKCAMDDICKS